MSQKEAFISSEGDAWFERNSKEQSVQARALLTAIQNLQIKPDMILEVGCGGGAQLDLLQMELGCKACGVDPSSKAIRHASETYKEPSFREATADDLPYPDASFDIIILGFCLYLTDPKDHFQIAWQIDRLVRDGGYVVIKDFLPPYAYRNSYVHRSGLFSYKMKWSEMFIWHPSYSLVSRTYCEHDVRFTFSPDERVAIDIIRKDAREAFVDRLCSGI